MKNLISVSVVSALLLVGGSATAGSENPTYGELASGYLSVSEANSLAYLAWPQTAADMEGRYGYPRFRGNGYDEYRVWFRGRSYPVWIYYGDRTTAIGFEFP